ncbi:MAG: glycosyltransferase family 4 protein [Bacillota bacterium]
MRIVIPALSLELGGGTRSLVRLAEGLARHGHAVELLIPTGARVHWELPVPVRWVPALTPQAFPPCDLILTNFWPTVLPAVRSGAGKVVRLSQGFEPLWVQDPGARESYLLPVPILAISHWLADQIRRETGREARVIPLGVDQPTFGPPEPGSERRGLLYIWRHKSQGYDFKGSDDLLRALGHVFDFYPELPVTLISPDPFPVEMHYPCEIHFAPDDAQLAACYRQTALFVSTSWFEAFSLAPLEAMACGAPVVSTDCGGVREYARDGQNCLLVPPREPRLLAEAILRVLRDRALGARLGAGGVETGREWSWERSWKAVDQALCSLV